MLKTMTFKEILEYEKNFNKSTNDKLRQYHKMGKVEYDNIFDRLAEVRIAGDFYFSESLDKCTMKYDKYQRELLLDNRTFEESDVDKIEDYIFFMTSMVMCNGNLQLSKVSVVDFLQFFDNYYKNLEVYVDFIEKAFEQHFNELIRIIPIHESTITEENIILYDGLIDKRMTVINYGMREVDSVLIDNYNNNIYIYDFLWEKLEEFSHSYFMHNMKFKDLADIDEFCVRYIHELIEHVLGHHVNNVEPFSYYN